MKNVINVLPAEIKQEAEIFYRELGIPKLESLQAEITFCVIVAKYDIRRCRL